MRSRRACRTCTLPTPVLVSPLIHCTLSTPQAGLDSLGAVELRNALTSRFAISLPATVTFDHPTLAALSAFIARQLAPAADSAAAAAAAAAADSKTARVQAEEAGWLSGSDSDSSGGGEYTALERELRLAGQYQQYHEQYHEQYRPTTTDLLGVGCIFPGASGSQAAVSAAGKAACMFACRFSLVALQGCAARVAWFQTLCMCAADVCVCVCQLQAAITLPLAQASHCSQLCQLVTHTGTSLTDACLFQSRLPLHPHSAHYPSPKQPSLAPPFSLSTPFVFLPFPRLVSETAGFGSFWAAAAVAADLQRPVPHQRWDLEWYYAAEAALGKSYARFGAFEEVRDAVLVGAG